MKAMFGDYLQVGIDNYGDIKLASGNEHRDYPHIYLTRKQARKLARKLKRAARKAKRRG